ncbi:MAG: Hpt domain-containing protein, partial [Gammaproteobacteria bacterium]|nr:Hpt domain-containing protein [Gammaproteobacteria bacterium]
MFMAPLDILAPLIRGISEYVETVLLKARHIDPEQLDVVADAVTSIEYYLEAVIEGRKDLDADLNFGRSAVDKLRVFTSELADPAAATPVETSAPQAEIQAVEIPESTDEEISIDSDLSFEESLISEDDLNIDADIEPVSLDADLELEAVDGSLSVAEEAVVQPAAVKPKPVAAPSEREELAIISDDIDEEIFEIFIEEAIEVLGAVNESLPIWKADNSNDEAQATVRRSFHTLKGSGRLIGAMMIGEFSWSIENMLNRVIDNTVTLSPEVFSILDEAAAVLPQLIEQMQGNQQPVANIYDLMDHADALSKGEKYSPPAEAEVAEVVASEAVPVEEVSLPDAEITFDEDSLELPVDDVISFTEDDSSIDFDETSLDFADEIEFETSEVAPEITAEIDTEIADEITTEIDLVSEDELLPEVDLSEDLSSEFDLTVDEDEVSLDLSEDDVLLDVSIDESELIPEAADTSLDEIPTKVEIDEELFNIFRAESEGHLNTIRHMLILNQTDGTHIVPGDELIRALHTLYGSARTAEVAEIGTVCGIAEQYIKILQSNQVAELDQDGIATLNELVGTVTEVLNNLEQGAALKLNQVLVDKLERLYEIENQKSPEASSADINVPDNELVSYGDIDDELVDIFLEEAEELVEGAEKSLESWKEDNSDVESVNELKRILHTLKGGARMAELAPIGDLTHALETTIIEVAETDPSAKMAAMQEALDSIVSMLAKVTAREPLHSAASTIALLNQAETAQADAVDLSLVDTDEGLESFSLEVEEPADIEDLASFEIEEPSVAEDISSFEITDDFDTEFSSPDLSDDFDDEIEIDILSSDDDVLEVEAEELNVFETPNETVEDEPAIEEPIIEEPVIEEQTIAIAEPYIDSTELVTSTGSNVFKLDHDLAKSDDEPKAKVVQEQVRVRAELLNDLVNNAGEVNIYNSRFNQQLSNFGYNLSEFDQTVNRLREQLRKLEIETENQILSRHETESSHYDADFDPLEMDRYSTLQQLSRSLTESVSDLESIKDFLNNTVRESETLLQQQSRISTELQESLMRTRMIKFSGLSSRLGRIVRQTSRELNKTVEFEVIGDELEVDRSILDRIVSPLEHLLRNAVSHGIETDEARAALNKTEPGKV